MINIVCFLASLRKLDMQPEWLKGGELRDYQLEGLNFLVNRYLKAPLFNPVFVFEKCLPLSISHFIRYGKKFFSICTVGGTIQMSF